MRSLCCLSHCVSHTVLTLCSLSLCAASHIVLTLTLCSHSVLTFTKWSLSHRAHSVLPLTLCSYCAHSHTDSVKSTLIFAVQISCTARCSSLYGSSCLDATFLSMRNAPHTSTRSPLSPSWSVQHCLSHCAHSMLPVKLCSHFVLTLCSPYCAHSHTVL